MPSRSKSEFNLIGEVGSEILFRMIERMSEGILFVDPEGKVIAANEAARSLRREYSGREIPMSILDCHTPRNRGKVLEIITEVSTGPNERRMLTIQVDSRHYEIVYSGVFDPKGRYLGTLAVSRDVSERIVYEQRLSELASFDSLTGVYNRCYFYERLEDEIARAERQGHPLALALFDVDGFKEVNDSLGHQEGDRVLVEVATIARKSIRAGVDIVARYGGDEFIIILPEADVEIATEALDRIRKKAEKIKPKIGLSIGLAELNLGVNLEELVRRADIAMFEAKKSGCGIILHTCE